MIRLETQVLGGFNETMVDEPATFDVVIGEDRSVDYDTVVSNTPAVTSTYDAHDQRQLSLASADFDDRIWDEERFYPVGRLSAIHGRNLQILAGRVAIEDGFGNHYQSIGIKGSIFTDPHLVESETASRNFIIYGLQESLVMERVLRASRILREYEVGTEYICGLVAPLAFPAGIGETGIHEEEDLELPRLVESLASKYAKAKVNAKLDAKPKSPKTDEVDESALQIKSNIIETLHDVDYLITYRAMDTPFRLGEISDDEMFEEFCDDVYSNNPEPLVQEYLETIGPIAYVVGQVAPELASNVARMHDIGLTHGFIHINNITAMGSIVDLDSCKGEPLGLGDDPIDKKAVYEDVLDSIHSFSVFFNDKEPVDKIAEVGKFIVLQTANYLATAIFMKHYLEERFDDKSEAADFVVDLIISSREHYTEQYDTYARLCERLTAGYISYLGGNSEIPDIDFSDLPPFEEAPHTFGRSDTMLRSVPARFFKEYREKLLSLGWTMNSDYDGLKDEAKPVFNPVKSALRNISLQLFAEHLDQSGYSANALKSIIAMKFASHIVNIDPENADREDDPWHDYFVEQLKFIVDQLSDEETQPDTPVMQYLLAQGLEDLKDQTGLFQWDDFTVPVLYLNGPTQYSRIFSKLENDPDQPVGTIGTEEILSILQENDGDTIFLIDYYVSKFIAEISGKARAFNSLFGRWKGRSPTLIVRGILSGDPKIFVLEYGLDSNDEQEQKDGKVEKKQGTITILPSNIGSEAPYESHPQLF